MQELCNADNVEHTLGTYLCYLPKNSAAPVCRTTQRILRAVRPRGAIHTSGSLKH
jgi:hypothetical protein